MNMATSTNWMGNLDHPRLMSEPIDLAHQEVRTGGIASASVAVGRQAAPLHAPAKSTDLPCDLQTLLKCRLFSVKHVPAGCQERVTSVLAGTISAYCRDPCEAWLFGLLAFPKLVLRTAPSKGSRASEHLQAAMDLRLQLFCLGHYKQLWDQALRECPNANTFTAPVTRAAKRQKTGGGEKLSERTVNRVRELVGEGASKKALQLLTSSGIHDSSDPAVIRRLRELHPSAEGILPLYAA